MESSWEQFENKIRGLSGPQDFGVVLHEVARQTRDDTRDRFMREVAPDGSDWPELAESTKDKKRRQGLPLVTLVAHGALWESLGSIDEVSSDSLRWGTDDPKAQFHDSDEPRKSKARLHDSDEPNLPQRQIVGFSAEAVDRIEEQVADFVEEAVLSYFDA